MFVLAATSHRRSQWHHSRALCKCSFEALTYDFSLCLCSCFYRHNFPMFRRSLPFLCLHRSREGNGAQQQQRYFIWSDQYNVAEEERKREWKSRVRTTTTLRTRHVFFVDVWKGAEEKIFIPINLSIFLLVRGFSGFASETECFSFLLSSHSLPFHFPFFHKQNITA